MAMREDDRCRQRAIGGELAQQLAIGKTHANRSVLGGGTRRTGCALSPVTRQRRSGISSSTPSLMSSFTRPHTEHSSICVRALISLRVKSKPGHQPRKSTIFCCCAGSLPFSRTLSYAISDESATSVFMRAETLRPPPPGTPRRRSSSAFASRDRRSCRSLPLAALRRHARHLLRAVLLAPDRRRDRLRILRPMRRDLLRQRLETTATTQLRLRHHTLLSMLAPPAPSPPSRVPTADSKESATQVSPPPNTSPSPSPDHSRDCAALPPTS